MDSADLKDLVDDIRDGLQESTAVDWKRQWWRLKDSRGVAEFVRDVAAMANGRTKDSRMIVLGVSEKGTLHGAPIPEDEANLQTRLHAIDPVPSVAFSTHEVDGVQLSVVAVLPPFDPPYVASVNNQHVIPVRQGSRTVTATRRMLDNWYKETRDAPQLALVHEGEEVGDSIQTVRPWAVAEGTALQRDVASNPERDEETYALAEKIFGKTVMGFARFSLGLPDTHAADCNNLDYWLRLDLQNNGAGPAEDLVVEFDFEGADEVDLWDAEAPHARVVPFPRGRWQTDTNEPVYVHSYGESQLRQRVRSVNPSTVESLVPMRLRSRAGQDGRATPIVVTFRATDRCGVQCEGAFSIVFEYRGEKRLPPQKPTF